MSQIRFLGTVSSLSDSRIPRTFVGATKINDVAKLYVHHIPAQCIVGNGHVLL